MVSVDTLRADHLNAYGFAERSTSAALDALARNGILFERHIAASPWTTPSHLSLLTSLSPSVHGVTEPFGVILQGLRTGQGIARLPDTVLTLPEALARAGWQTAAFTGGATLDPRLGFGRGFARYDTTMEKLNQRNVGTLLDWIEAHKARPFFLFWHTFEVHAPYLRTTFLDEVLSPATASLVRRDLEHLARRGDRKSIHEVQELLIREGVFTPEVCRALYDGGVRWADDALARVVARLKTLGLYDQMLIVFTSDHGEQLGDRSVPWPGTNQPTPGWGFYNTHGHTVYEEIIRVPLVIKLPGGVGSGRRVRRITRAVDVMPTVLDVLGVRVAAPLEGSTLRPLWEGSTTTPGRWALSESLAHAYEEKAFQDERYKYTVEVGEETVAAHGRWYVPPQPAAAELYDLQLDPGERSNLLASPTPANRAHANAMDRALRDLLSRHGAADRLDLRQEDIEGLRALGYVE
jgi:arylsulfatase A-like enzyme